MPLQIASRIENALADCKSHRKCFLGLQVALKMPLRITSRIANAIADWIASRIGNGILHDPKVPLTGLLMFAKCLQRVPSKHCGLQVALKCFCGLQVALKMSLRIASRIQNALADYKSHSKCPCGLQVALKMPLRLASRIENALADCKSH